MTNYDDYEVTCGLHEVAHGATAADLLRKGFADHVVKAVFARIDERTERSIKAGPDVDRDSRIAGFVSRFEPGAGA